MIEHFHRPRTVREALSIMRKFPGRAAFLAGGTYLNSSDSGLSPEHCVSLADLPLDRVEPKPGLVAIGALCTLERLIEDRRVPRALQRAIAQVMSRNIRNAATLGGHLASDLPYSDVIPMLVALEAKVALAGPRGVRTMPVAEYVQAPPAGLITRILVPRPDRRRRAACVNARGSANGRSTVSVAVSLTLAKDVVRDPIVAVGGVTPRVVRLAAVEARLAGRPLPAPEELPARVSRAVRPGASPFASPTFRKYQAGVVVAQALAAACRQEGGRR